MDTMDVYEDYIMAKQIQGLSTTTLHRYKYSIKRVLTELGKDNIAEITTSD